MAAVGLAVLAGANTVNSANPAPVAPTNDLAGAVAALTPGPPRAVVLPASRPTRLRIPAIGVDVDVITDLGLQADRTMQVPADARTVGWYTNSPTPGERGPAVLAAHVDWNHQKGVFYDLHTLSPGDQVVIERADDSIASFTVLRVERYPKDRFPTQTVYGDVENPELRLITCGGQFDREAGSYRDNIVVFAAAVPPRTAQR